MDFSRSRVLLVLLLSAVTLGPLGAEDLAVAARVGASVYTLVWNVGRAEVTAYRASTPDGRLAEAVTGAGAVAAAGFEVVTGDFSGPVTVVKRQTADGLVVFTFEKGGRGRLEVLAFDELPKTPSLSWSILP